MATFQILPPENFSFTRPEEWPRWTKCFERYRQASGLSEKVANERISLRYGVPGLRHINFVSSLRGE